MERMNQLFYLNPVTFIFDSLAFMEGYPRAQVWLYMPKAYLIYSFLLFRFVLLNRA